MQSYTLAYEGNVFLSTYAFDLEERRNSLEYSFWMFDKFAPGLRPDAADVRYGSQLAGEMQALELPSVELAPIEPNRQFWPEMP